VGHGRYTLYNAVNRAGANNNREVRGPLLVEVLAANRRDKDFNDNLHCQNNVFSVLLLAGAMAAR
jgi:hypothetical protein